MLSYRLREAMGIRRKTQEELAAEAGVSQPHISRILSGEREPTIDIVVWLGNCSPRIVRSGASRRVLIRALPCPLIGWLLEDTG